MNEINLAPARDHALVRFHAEIDWPAMHELVNTIKAAVDDYFYSEVELLVDSPGGDARALNYFLAEFENWRRQGVRFRTRVISQAASAGAIMVSIGDERVAETGARLLFHNARAMIGSHGLTASMTSTVRGALDEFDDEMIERLAARALDAFTDAPKVPCKAERTDRLVLVRLHDLVSGSGTGTGLKRRSLARTIGRAVKLALRAGDREALMRIYRCLFELDTPISARLARTLRLVDRIGSRTVKASRVGDTRGLAIPEWRSLYPPDGEVPREVLTRHTLVLGETGSGKTASCVLPVVASLARTPPERLGAALIIDPKHELGPALERLAPARLHHVTTNRVVFDLMSGPHFSLQGDLDAGRWQSAADRILKRVASFVPSNPARVLTPHTPGSSNDEFFAREGASFAATVLGFILILTHPDAEPPEQWIDENDTEASDWVDKLLSRARGATGERGPNALALTGWALNGPLCAVTDGNRPTWLFARLARMLLAHLRDDVTGEGRDLLCRILDYWKPMAEIDRQHAGVLATAANVCAEFAAPAIARTLYFGCERGFLSERQRGPDFARLVSSQAPGTLVLFQPARDGHDNLVAVALKAAFFEAVLNDQDRVTGAKDLPLVGYVADEFHRFITSDPVHGEQSFLDTCRSFGAFCVLASQSVASLEHALSHKDGNDRQDESAVAILWNNTASKLVFRTTDAKTANRVDELCPHRPGRSAVVRVRPVSTLGTGECYAILADGRFERRQLAPFDPDARDKVDPDGGVEPCGLDEGETS